MVLFPKYSNQEWVISVHFANTFSEMLSTLHEAKYIEKIQQMGVKGRLVTKLLIVITQHSLSLTHIRCSLFRIFNTLALDFVASLPW